MKVCTDCKVEKPLSSFGVNFAGTPRETFRNQCTRCKHIRQSKFTKLRYKCSQYGITDLDYMKMEFDQDKRCAICKQSKPLEIDHCHITGKVRGLLCRTCNAALGMVKDDIDILREAISYLEKNE